MFLDYFALGLLFFAAIVLFYGIIAIHDIPYEVAKHRNHPQQDAIHVAGWISLFTLHVIWPFLWIWATLYREDRGWGFASGGADRPSLTNQSERVDALSQRIDALEQAGGADRPTLTNLREQVDALSQRIDALEQAGGD